MTSNHPLTLEKSRSFLCGNGVLDPGEICDYRSATPQTCNENCLIPQCYGCNTRGYCEETPRSLGSSECGAFSFEPTCGDSCPFGAPVPTPDESIALCTLPVEDRPADSQIREYDDYTLISQCQTDTSVLYTFCGRGGDVTVSIGVCPTGQICSYGGCVEAGPAPGEPFCIDTDEADDPYVRGSMVGVDDGGTAFARMDYCSGEGERLHQLSCVPVDSSGRDSSSESCPDGEHCEDGICVPSSTCEPACVDSDPTSDVYSRGMVSGVNDICVPFTHYDSCTSLGAVSEATCTSANTYDEVLILCPEGETCSGGVCTVCERTCSDTDLLNDIYSYGYTSVSIECSSTAYHDECAVDGRVRQFSCGSDNRERESYTRCPTGEVCSGGVCIPDTITCIRTPATATTAGYVTAADGTIQHDICDGSTVVTYVCDAEGRPTEGSRISCPRGCRTNTEGVAIGLCNP